MFKRVLIANRGEIAIRIARAAASLGVDSVAVFTKADAMSLHTKLAGSAREIGGDAVRGYLDIEAVIAAARPAAAIASTRATASCPRTRSLPSAAWPKDCASSDPLPQV
jgi:acetyl/propionyl-CoA carboxylase alpha subunit